jgi:hypothetical protein
MMWHTKWQTKSCVTGGALALLMFSAGSASAHSVREAELTLYRQGYHDVEVERASLPYSFNACKRGVRYHIHVDYYGDLVQVDRVGRCYGNGKRNGYAAEGDYGRYNGRYRYRASGYDERPLYNGRHRH